MNNHRQNPWLSIWFSPRATIARITASNPNQSLWILAAIYGFTSILNVFQSGAIGSQLSTLSLFLIAAVLSPIWGYLSFAIWSGLIAWTGKWLKGKGKFSTVRAAYAWSCVPFVFHIPLWIWMGALFGKQLFQNFPDHDLLTQSQVSLLFAIMIIKVILAIWSLVIYVNALAEVQSFSIFRAILNLIAAGIILVALLILLWVLVFYFTGAVTAHSMTTFHLWNDGITTSSLRELLNN